MIYHRVTPTWYDPRRQRQFLRFPTGDYHISDKRFQMSWRIQWRP